MCTLIYAVTIDDVLHKLVDILLHFPSGSHDLSPAERELDPSHMAIHLIKEVAQGNEMCQEILCKVRHSVINVVVLGTKHHCVFVQDSFMLYLISPLKKLQEGQVTNYSFRS